MEEGIPGTENTMEETQICWSKKKKKTKRAPKTKYPIWESIKQPNLRLIGKGKIKNAGQNQKIFIIKLI